MRGSIGLLAPAGTPVAFIEQIAQATRTAVAEPAFGQMLLEAGIETTIDSGPEKFRQSLAADLALWAPVVQTLGLRIGVAFQQVQKYEKGTNRVGSSRLRQIADVLETTPAWFFESVPRSQDGRASADTTAAELATFMADQYAVRLIRGFVKLRPELRKSFVALIELAGA